MASRLRPPYSSGRVPACKEGGNAVIAMPYLSWAVAATLAALWPLPVPYAISAAAAEPKVDVDVAIVFVVDMSESMDADERRILRDSHADAVVSDIVLEAIAEGELGRVALAYVEFGNVAVVRVGWSIVDGRDSAERFRDQILGAPMANLGFTGIGGGLELARVMLAFCPCRPTKQVVDVAADGKNNTIPSLYLARRALLETGAAINGLPIEIRPWDVDITAYFAEHVIGGPAAFNLPVTGMEELPERLRQKILLDLY
jgi:hypothetical protein